MIASAFTYATIKGFEVMRALRKNQAAIFNITRDIRGEARLVERAFGLGPSALAEAVPFCQYFQVLGSYCLDPSGESGPKRLGSSGRRF